MVRHFSSSRLAKFWRAWRRFFARLWAWLRQSRARLGTVLQVANRLIAWSVRPADPNNFFIAGEQGSFHRSESARRLDVAALAAAGGQGGGVAITLRGLAPPNPARTDQGIRDVNRQYSYRRLLKTELRRTGAADLSDLEAVIRSLAKRWLDLDVEFSARRRRHRLDIQKTLRYNLPRYGGRVLDFRWGSRELPIPQLTKPARLLVIGDASHSMVRYSAIGLYFIHKLNFLFEVDSYVFSEQATRATPFMKGSGSFDEKIGALTQKAKSWNAGTRFGRSLTEILAQAKIDQYTHVIIVTDGKVTLGHGEYELIHQGMAAVQARARQIIFLTPEGAFAGSQRRAGRINQVGTFESGVENIPIFDLGQIWYSTLGQYADRIYHVRTVGDLVAACEDLYRAAR